MRRTLSKKRLLNNPQNNSLFNFPFFSLGGEAAGACRQSNIDSIALVNSIENKNRRNSNFRVFNIFTEQTCFNVFDETDRHILPPLFNCYLINLQLIILTFKGSALPPKARNGFNLGIGCEVG